MSWNRAGSGRSRDRGREVLLGCVRRHPDTAGEKRSVWIRFVSFRGSFRVSFLFVGSDYDSSRFVFFVLFFCFFSFHFASFRFTFFEKKCERICRPSKHPPVREKNIKTFRWDRRLQIQNLVTLGRQYNVAKKPTVILYTCINRHAGTQKNKNKKNNVVHH